MKIIYSKATFGRKKEFQIETKILTDNNKKYVLKRGLFDNKHIENIINNSKLLKNIYNESIDIPEKYDDGIIVPFIEGNSLLDVFKENKNDAINKYLNILDNKDNLCQFIATNDFKNIFGDFNKECISLKLANIDLTLSNVLISDNDTKFIDLEWVYNFPIPVDFIKYRCILDILNNSNENIDDLFKLFKIELSIDELDKMEKSFENYMLSNDYSLEFKKENYIFSALEDSSNEIKRLNEENLKKNEDYINLEKETNEIKENYQKIKTDYDNKIYEISLYKNEIEKLKSDLNEKNSSLNIVSDELNHIKNSHTYKFWIPYFKIRDFFLPKNSKRRLFVKLLFSGIRHPIWFIKHLTPTNIKKFGKYYNSEGADRVYERINVYKANATEMNSEIKLDIYEMKDRKAYNDLALPKPSKNPLVSIIIPVYNQYSYTYGCLESIINNTKGIDYEVIIADDCSTDETKDIKFHVANIIVARNRKNTRFLLNCNNAAKYARGKYLFFLNNDTNVQPNYLSSLLETIESNPKIGMVGSKLVYPNGQLQEAGGILWKDGSAWNFGNKSNPENSEFNYRKPVDYISGAAIMISKELWDKIGGFDKTFCPAYCEDSDLAFTVRKLGYDVIYDPFSVVVHYEGISNGTDVKQGVKKYQVDNSLKFYNKWKDVLDKHFPNAENVFIARDRSYNKKTLLMIDHYVPMYDKDAGSRTVYMYLELFVKMGFNVKFIGENFYRHEPYTSVLQKMGVEVLYGSYYAQNYQEWLRLNGKYIDYVFFNRPHITTKFIDVVKANTPNAKYMYYGHDLHYVRVAREAELKDNNSKMLEESNNWKKMEYDIFNKVDMIFYPSITEKHEIAKIDNNLDVRVLQPYAYSDIEDITYDYDKRDGLLFVGGFRHGPNYDGIKWFLENVYPNIVKKYPNIVIHIAGSYPPEELVKMGNKNIIIEGFVTDEILKELYNNARLVVVPLRYGAGIKGKVIEAMKMGTPVITTTCGAEGIDTDAICVDDTLEKTIDLYQDKEWLQAHSKMGIQYIKNEYSMESALKKLENDIIDLDKKGDK